MDLKNVIEQRKTIKAFDPNHIIERNEFVEMLTLAQLAPSKANLQPWRFVVVDDKAVKQSLLPHLSFNAPPVETASAVILVLADLQYGKVLGDILDHSVASGCLQADFRDRNFAFLADYYQSSRPDQIRDQTFIDASLASMQLMLVAKDRGYDTHAIGIFDRDAVMSILSVDHQRYAPIMLLAIGKAATSADRKSVV